MVKSASLVPVVLAWLLIFASSAASAESTTIPNTIRPLVVATTTVLGSVVRDLAGDLVVTEVIASPAACPAHYDIRPSDVDAFRRADLILAHGVEPWVSVLKEASGTRAPVVVVRGGWGTPAALKDLYRAVAKVLMDNLGINVSGRLEASVKAIDESEAWLRSFAAESGFVGKPVVAMRWQRAFVEFLGFRVVAAYGPPGSVTAREYEDVIANATREGAILVVDNLQSGVELGESIAMRVGAVHVALTNFPWVQPGVSNITDMMRHNARLLSKALVEAVVKGELVRVRSEVEVWKAITVASSSLAVILAATTAILTLRLRRARSGGR